MGKTPRFISPKISTQGVSLVEVLVASVILILVIVGTYGFLRSNAIAVIASSNRMRVNQVAQLMEFKLRKMNFRSLPPTLEMDGPGSLSPYHASAAIDPINSENIRSTQITVT